MQTSEQYVPGNLAYDNDIEIEGEKTFILSPIAAKVKKRYGYLFFKRLFDFVFSLAAIIMLLPVFLLLAVAIKLEDGGPVIFAHERIGKSGKKINIYKFRSMVTNAEEMIAEFTPEQKVKFEQDYKLDDDFRITKVGKSIRKTSLDELPQLINILVGDLSIVGPRPVVEAELKKYGCMEQEFSSVKPGLTGYWQVNGRSTTTYDDRIRLELYYVENCSLWLDFKIIFKTVPAVLFSRGAQ